MVTLNNRKQKRQFETSKKNNENENENENEKKMCFKENKSETNDL